MPYTNPYIERWRQREESEAESLKLEEDEVSPFLNYVLGDVARRPPEIRLREAARVVRFLRRLALGGMPKPQPARQTASRKKSQQNERPISQQEQRRLHALGETIWNIVLQNAPIEPCGAMTTIRFLKRYEGTFLAHHGVEEAVRTIRGLELPVDAEDPFSPPNLISRAVTSTGKGNPHLADDLSERIYGAYFALRRQRLSKVDQKIADVLQRLGTEGKKPRQEPWTYPVVQDRIKRYKGRKARELATNGETPAAALERWSQYIADFHIMAFREHQTTEEQQRPHQSSQKE